MCLLGLRRMQRDYFRRSLLKKKDVVQVIVLASLIPLEYNVAGGEDGAVTAFVWCPVGEEIEW